MKKTLEKIVLPLIFVGFLGANILGNHLVKKYNPNMKAKVGFPYLKMYDINGDSNPDKVDSYVATRGYALKISREPTQEEIDWYKSN